MSDDVEQLIAAFEARMAGSANYAVGLAGLAQIVAERKHKKRAAALARKAIAAAGDDPRLLTRVRAKLSSLLPSYHLPMMTDARRNAAWDGALRRAIKPGMHVFEIGTGAGMLALMAARAGAAKVTTCELDPLAAELARALAARNGYGDRIEVLTKRSTLIEVGTDLERRADLLFCDIFGDDLFDFAPLASIADAKSRLLLPDAVVVPAAASLQVALAHWGQYERYNRIASAAGFDISPMADFAQTRKTLDIGSPDLRLVTAQQQMFRFDFAAASWSGKGQNEVACTAERDGVANGIVHWIKLELDEETVLEARPEPGAVFFSSPIFQALSEPRHVAAGQSMRVAASYDGAEVETWLAE